MSSTRALVALGVVFAAPFVYAVATPSRTATALLPLQLTLLGVMPALSGLCLLAARRWKSSARTNLLLTLASIAVALFLAELLSPLFGHVSARAKLAANAPSSFDDRDKLQVVLDLQAQGLQAVPSIEPKGLLIPTPEGALRSRLRDHGEELQPLGGVAGRPTVVCNETGAWITYESDRFGMNNPDGVWDLEEADLAAVGDSFTNGWCADDDTHYVSLIRARHPRTINLAQSGNGPLLILAGIHEYLEERRPRRVVWFHYEGNDFLDLGAERQSALLRGYLDSGTKQGLPTRQAAIDREVLRYVDTAIDEWRDLGDLAIGGFDATPDAAAVRRLLKLGNVRRYFGLNYTVAFDPDYELFDRIVRAAHRAVSGWGGKLHLVYLPSSARYRVVAGSSGPWEADRVRVTAIAERLGIPLVDLHAAFAAHGRPLSLYTPIIDGDYGHFSAEGNRIVAAAVLEAIGGAER